MPGVRIRFLPFARAVLIFEAESPGLAMKNLSMEMEFPSAGPLPQVVSDESVRSAGTNTLYLPSEAMYRNGFSRVTGLVSSVVYAGGLYGTDPNDCAGAPTTPEKTWFQTALDQPPMLLSRTRNCCCDPLMMKPVWESAMKPPLAYCGPAVQ